MRRKNEKGFTLVEILAALTILGTVFISFMTIFPQMTNMNDRTEAKLETMNIAKSLLSEIKDKELEGKLPSRYMYAGVSGKDIIFIAQKDHYVVEMICSPRDRNSPMCSKTDTERETRDADLYKIHIQVKKENKFISETFGYAKLK
ncbi:MULTISPECIES: PulJ/GspJ family protein [unclassified Sporosarcina]|uniref:PulJ/GspJ family protein n=1 Tax=unclassified Sporosarcina TaxID=2647733 RepID=UPI0013041D06|nr:MULTISPECIES: type II secretion system protein [unclassified Sporosarcina]